MAETATPITGHLAHDLLHTLADLDRGDKLLGISSLFHSETIEWQSIKHPVGFAVLYIFLGLLAYLIRHIVLRTAGTLMVRSKTQDHRTNTSRQSNHGILGFLYQAVASHRRLRRDVFLGLTYNIIYSLLANLLSGFSSSSTWNLICHIIAVLLLSPLHLRWTCAILSLKQPVQTRILSLPRRKLLLSALVYGLAYQATARLPMHVAGMASGYRGDEIVGIAFADAVVLVAAFGLRMLVLYPAFAACVYSEIQQVVARDAGDSVSEGAEGYSGLGVDAHGRAVQLCFKKTAIWFGLLHLQMVVLLAGFEILVAPLIYKMVF